MNNPDAHSPNPAVKKLLDDKALLHPVADNVPSYLDLIRHIERINGRIDLPPPHRLEHRIAGFVGSPRHLVFVIIDGMGLNVSPHFPRGGFLDRTFACELRALFPSTTANVLTATETARWPAAGPDTGTRVRIVPEELQAGGFTRWAGGNSHIAGYKDLEEVRRLVSKTFEREPTRSYTSVYIPDVDSLSHTCGHDSPEVGACIARLDRLLEQISAGLPPETRIVVTADHGQVRIPPDRHLCVYDGDPLLEFLDTPPSGEATVPIFHVGKGRVEEFRRWFEASRFGHWFDLLSTDGAIQLGLYGQEPLSERMKERLGTFTGIASEPVLLDYVPTGHKRLNHVGSHGGLRPEEMRLGLFVYP